MIRNILAAIGLLTIAAWVYCELIMTDEQRRELGL